MRHNTFLMALFAQLTFATLGFTQKTPQVFVGARIIPVSPDGSVEIEDGVLVIEEGKIVAVGPAGSVDIL